MATHNIKLPRLSAKYLSDLLQSTGWTRTTSDVYYAGSILVDKLEPIVPLVSEEDAKNVKKMEEWAQAEVEFELTEPERDVCKFVIEKYSKEGKVPTNRFGFQLIKGFGLGPV